MTNQCDSSDEFASLADDFFDDDDSDFGGTF